MNVLITSIGSNTAISVIKAFKLGNKLNPYIIGTDINPIEFCAGSKFVDKFIQMPSALHERTMYMDKILNIISKYKIDCCIPIHDVEIEVISQLKNEFQNITFWAVNDCDIIETCNNKLKANQVARKNQIPIPLIYEPDKLESIDLPILIKPIKGVSSKSIRKIDTKKDLEPYLQNNYLYDNFIQEFISGDEYTVDCYCSYITKKFYGGVVRKRIETKAGISVKGEVVIYNELIEYCKSFLESICFRGASNIQYIINHSNIYFLEINPRFSGGGILSYNANFNSPIFTLLEAKEKALPSFSALNIRNNLKMSRYWEEVFYE